VTTYGDLKTRIANEIGRTTDPDIDAAVVNAIADAIKYYSATPFWFLETSQDIANISGTASYSLPSDYRAMVSVSQSDDTAGEDLIPLMPIQYARYRDLVSTATTTTGRPYYYALYGETILLYPTPNAVRYTRVYYTREIEALSSDDGTNAWTTHAEPLIRTRAKIDLFINYIRDASGDEVQRLGMQEAVWLQQLQRRSSQFQATGRVVPTAW
jgi:hypothetical protein